MNNRATFIVQLIGDLAIPLLGYFLWDWSLFFILLFYLIENLFYSVFRIETIREIKKVVLKKDQTRDIKSLLKTLLLWSFECVLVHFLILEIYPKQSLFREWIHFLMYEDLGIPQGIILLPLLYFTSRMKMKQNTLIFIRNMKSSNELSTLAVNFTTTWIAFGFWGILLGINYFYQLHELLNLSIILLFLVFRNFRKN